MIHELARWPGRSDWGRVRDVLASGPWLWPLEGEALQRACQIAGGERPVLRPGQALLVTVAAGSPALWQLSVGASDARPWLRVAEFGPQGKDAWHAAALAVPRALPLLWSSLKVVQQQRIKAVHLCSLPLIDGQVAIVERVVDGPSFGLAFVLALTSIVCRAPLPDDVIASAAVDASGQVGAVDGLVEKVQIVLRAAPGISRFLVARDQIEATAAAVASRMELSVEETAEGGRRLVATVAKGEERALHLIPVDSAAEAVQVVFGNSLASLIVGAGTAENRQEMTRAFFRLALRGRGDLVDWMPVARAADLALGAWGCLDRDAVFRLEFARAVAGRHQGAEYRLDVPTPEWLAAQPATLRIQVLSHLVQQSADFGRPSAPSILAIALEQIPILRQASNEQLKLAGAVARLMAVTGRALEALQWQEELARIWADGFEEHECSYPLSEWFRLAGACLDPAAFARAMDFSLQHHEHLDSDGVPYVALARARATITLGIEPIDSAVLTLRQLSSDASLSSHLRWSATRWLVRAARCAGDEAGDALVALQRAAHDTGAEGLTAQTFEQLIRADAAKLTGDLDAFQLARQRLERLEPALMRQLWESSSADATAFVEFFPY